MASTVREKDMKKLREARYLAKKIDTIFHQRDRLSPLRSLMRESCSFPIFSVGSGFPSTHLSVESCITMGLIFMIFPPTLFSISRHSSSRERPFSGFRLTSACG